MKPANFSSYWDSLLPSGKGKSQCSAFSSSLQEHDANLLQSPPPSALDLCERLLGGVDVTCFPRSAGRSTRAAGERRGRFLHRLQAIVGAAAHEGLP